MRVILDTGSPDPRALVAARAYLRKHAPGFAHLSNSTRGTVHVALTEDGQRYRAVCGSTSGGPGDLTQRPVACTHCLHWLNGYKHALGLADD